MQCDEDSHCSGIREVKPCAADCASTWRGMCNMNPAQSAATNGSSSGSSSSSILSTLLSELSDHDLVTHCIRDKVPFRSNAENDYVCLRTSQVNTTRLASRLILLLALFYSSFVFVVC